MEAKKLVHAVRKAIKAYTPSIKRLSSLEKHPRNAERRKNTATHIRRFRKEGGGSFVTRFEVRRQLSRAAKYGTLGKGN